MALSPQETAAETRRNRLLTINEVAAQLRVEPRTVQYHMAARTIRYGVVGRVVRFRQVWVDEFLERKWDEQVKKKDKDDPSYS